VKSFAVEAFVLRRRPLGEADRIITLFSRERGKLSAVAKSARKAHSKFGARLDFFTRVQLSLHAGRSLDVITSVQSVHSIWDQLVHPDTFALVSYVAEVIDALCEPDLAIPDLYAVLCELQAVLGSGLENRDLLMAVTDLRILNALGVAPELDACARCGSVLGSRPLQSGRAVLSPQAGGLLCSTCLREIRAAGETTETRGLFPIGSRDFAALRAARVQPMAAIVEAEAAAQLRSDARVHKATHAFVEHQLGRRSKALSIVSAGSRLERSAGRRA
jgi:DNA repair protein RecO (recombination protein O)